jgi:tetratricopeptide (TPR) repeat protein
MNKIYWDYFRIGETAYREKMDFFEKNQRNISSLYFEELIDIKMDYLICLFEVGNYERFLLKVDSVLEIIIEKNILTYKGDKIFEALLFKKSACLYHTFAFEKSMKILKQLRSMDPQNRAVTDLYSLCKRKTTNDLHKNIKAIAMSSLMIVGGITLLKIVMVNPLYEGAITYFESLRYFFTFVFCGSLISSEILFQQKMYKEINMFSASWLNFLLKYVRKFISK